MHSPTFPGILSSKIYLDTLLYTPFFEGEIGDMKYYFVVTKDKQQCMLKFWDYYLPQMSITPQNVPQTSNSLLWPTK